MGVQGLWSLLDSSSTSVPIHTLRGKVLAIDVSIWLHQAVKGFRDKDGNPLPNAHLLGVFHRICKLLNYGIKPVFVFDGGVPVLKRQTINARKQKKMEAKDKSEETRTKLLTNLVRQQLQRQLKKVLPPTQQMEKLIPLLSPKKKFESPKKESRQMNEEDSDEDDFAKLRKKLEGNESLNTSFVSSLFSTDNRQEEASVSMNDSSDSDVSEESEYCSGRNYSEHFSSITSPNFDTLPLELQHEILFDMQESKKTNSWNKMHEMPKDLQNFSSFQMDRLVKRRFLQKKIQTVQKEMGERHIHVQNLDDLASFEAEFENCDEKEIIGSKETGALLIKAKNSGTNPGSSKSIISGSSCKTNEPEVITIDDYVEDWQSDESDDNEMSHCPTSCTTSVSVSQGISRTSSQNQVSEEDELQLAIALSLKEFQNPESLCEPTNIDLSFKNTSDKPLNLEQNEMNNSTKQYDNNLSDLQIQSSLQSSLPQTISDESFTDKLSSSLKNSMKQKQSPDASTGVKIQSNLLPTDFHKGSNSCYKFLGWVGFNENVSVVEPSTSFSSASVSEVKKYQNVDDSSNSSSGSDFEDVNDEKLNGNVDRDNLSEKPNFSVNKTEIVIPNSRKLETVIPVSIKLDESLEYKKEEDIFAHIFEEPEFESVDCIKNDSIEMELSESVETKSHSFEMELDENQVHELIEDEFESDFNDVIEEIEMVSVENCKPLDYNENPAIAIANESQLLTGCPSVVPPNVGVRIISAEFLQSQQKLNNAQKNLLTNQGIQDRIATSITDQMYIEAQELLSLFGIPYVISPMEAESQCAFFDMACLTEGTLTDDSDVWLFGGQRVYKNFFSQGEKPVQFFQYSDIVQHFNLDREKLVLMAILTGSDYTTGVEGVGPVLALEILTEFPGQNINAFDSLIKFREWWDSAQKETNREPANKIKSKLQKLKLRPSFPNKSVYDAYMDPTIDNSIEPFHWGKPNLDSIRVYTKIKFGWDDSKCDATLGPIFKNLNKPENHTGQQTTMDNFITITGKPYVSRHIKSKRVALAMKKLKRAIPLEPTEINLSSNSDDEEDEYVSISKIQPSSNNSKRKREVLKEGEKKQSVAKKLMKSHATTTSKSHTTVRIPKKIDTSIPQKVQAETRNKLLKEKAVALIRKKKGTH